MVSACTGSAQQVEDWKEPSRATAVAIDERCRPMTMAESNRAELALRVLQSFRRSEEMFDAAMGVFAYHDGDKPCLPETLKQQIAQATLQAGVWDRGFAGSIRLALAQQLGGRDPKIVEDVVRAAFHTEPVDDRGFSDLRPEARSVLASFGRSAAPWRVEALRLMHARDVLGTSAAQVAAASGDPSAIEAVARLLREELRSETGATIERNRAKLLVELAYALGSAGEAARPWVGVLIELLNHDVESLAPPFGVIERPPNEVCRALRRIGGVEAERALQGERCEEPWFLLPS